MRDFVASWLLIVLTACCAEWSDVTGGRVESDLKRIKLNVEYYIYF